jgi:hypothetical protein
VLENSMLLDLDAVVGHRHALDPDDRDADVVTHPRGGLGVEQPPAALDEDGAGIRAGRAVGGVDDDLGAVERRGEAVTGRQVDGVVRGSGRRHRGRAPAEHADRVAARGELSDGEAADGPRPARDRDVH